MSARAPDPTTLVPALLEALRAGATDADDALLALVYGELRRAAARLMAGERPGHTLAPTDLVHEAWLRLGLGPGREPVTVQDRAHLMALAVRAMRQVLIDHARRRGAGKRGAGAVARTLDEAVPAPAADPTELLALFDALDRLEALEPRLRQVVEHRYLLGLTEEETATLLGVTRRTVQRDWIRARAWLYRALYDAPPP